MLSNIQRTMFKLSQIIVNCSRTTSNRLLLNTSPSGGARFNRFSSSPTIAEPKTTPFDAVDHNEDNMGLPKQSQPPRSPPHQSGIVAAAFASLHSDNSIDEIQTPHTDAKITNAGSVNELLSISAEGNGISRKHALKVVSVLAEWSTSGRAKLSDFENDSRFLKLCKVLTRGARQTRNPAVSRNEDLSTILSVTADDEAAKLVATITVPQMVKVMSTLTQKKRRSTLLLRSLSYNITASSEQLDLKQSADLLYSMSKLNFLDDNLFAKISTDIVAELKKAADIKRSSVVGSIIMSIGLLKYRDPDMVDALSKWILTNHTICRPQDIFSLFVTLAVLNYFPANADSLFAVLVPQLTYAEARSPIVWLDVVWSLVLLKQATSQHVAGVLSDDFLEKLKDNTALTSTKLKLLNIDAAAQYLMKNYDGPRLSRNSSIRNVKITRTKDKNEMVDSVIDSIRNLIQSESNLQININTGFGFLIDAKCLLDRKCNTQPVNEANETKSDLIKVAIMAHDYHDMCKEQVEPTGLNVFAVKLLEVQGYRVVVVPYTEFNCRDKLVHRVQYLESKLKEIVVTC